MPFNFRLSVTRFFLITFVLKSRRRPKATKISSFEAPLLGGIEGLSKFWTPIFISGSRPNKVSLS